MNTLIRQQKNVLRHGFNYSGNNKYTKPYYRTFITRKHRFDMKYYSSISSLNHLNPVISAPTTHLLTSDSRQGGIAKYNDPFATQHRHFTLSAKLFEQPSSKVEASIQSIKNKKKEKAEEDLKKEITQILGTDTKVAETAKSSSVVVKKSLPQRVWDEIVHYYHGFRLLFVDLNICSKLVFRLLSGNKLTRRENRLLIRTTSDLFRLIPFSIFIIVPFMELLLPLFIKFFPKMLPSTFQTAKERDDRLKQSLQMKLEVAKFLQQTLDEMSVQHKDHKSEEAKQFSEFFQKIKDPNEQVSTEDIIKFSKRFEDEITLDSLNRETLTALCRVLELNTIGMTNFLRFQLRMKLRSLAADDRVIAREGVDALDLFELQMACKARGMRAYGLSEEKLRSQLKEWIELSLNEKVPPSLLLLSRALMMDEARATPDKLKETIRSLPDVLAAQTKAAIGEREGKIDNKTKIEIIKEEERKIKEEREEAKEEEKEKERERAETLVDKAQTIDVNTGLSTGQVAAPAKPEDSTISSEDVELLSEALETISKDKKTLLLEKETMKDLKEEIQDYKEDVEELREINTVEVNDQVKESRAAKILFKKVNSMIGQLDIVLADLETKGKKIEEIKEPEVVEKKQEELVRITDLINAIKKLKTTSNESRLKTIEKVLSKIDADQDGHIKVDDVLKVIEAIGLDDVNLNEKQLEELIDLLDKEEILEAEDKIEKAIAKSLKEVIPKRDPEEIVDNAPIITDKSNELKTGPTTAKEDALPKNSAKISSNIPPQIPPKSSSQTNSKDKML